MAAKKGGGGGSRIFDPLIKDEKLVYQIFAKMKFSYLLEIIIVPKLKFLA